MTRRRPRRRPGRRAWLPAGHLSSAQVAQALGVDQAEVRRQRRVLGALKQRNGRLAYPVETVRAELLARGLTPSPWFPRSPEQQRSRDRRQTLALHAAAVLVASGLGYAWLFTGDTPTTRTGDLGTLPAASDQVGDRRYGGGLTNTGSSGGSSGYTAPRITSATPTAVCSDGTVSYSASRRGTCSHHGGVAHWGPPTEDQPSAGAAASTEAGAATPSTGASVPEYNGECSPVGQAVLDRLGLLQPDGVHVALVSGWSLQGERGTVIGGYLSGAAHDVPVDGVFGSWYVRAADNTVHRYTDNVNRPRFRSGREVTGEWRRACTKEAPGRAA